MDTGRVFGGVEVGGGEYSMLKLGTLSKVKLYEQAKKPII